VGWIRLEKLKRRSKDDFKGRYYEDDPGYLVGQRHPHQQGWLAGEHAPHFARGRRKVLAFTPR